MTTEKAGWVIPKDFGGMPENYKQYIGVPGVVQSTSKKGNVGVHDHWWPSFACIPCPEPLPRGKYAVLANIYKGAFEEDVWTDFLKDKKVPELDYDFAAYLIFNYFDDKKMLLAATKVTGDIEIVDYDRWHFWHIGAGKEYREKVDLHPSDVDPTSRAHFDKLTGETELHDRDAYQYIKNKILGSKETQPDYRTLYEQAQSKIASLEESIDMGNHVTESLSIELSKEKALLEAAEAVIDFIDEDAFKLLDANYTIFGATMHNYQTLKEKHND